MIIEIHTHTRLHTLLAGDRLRITTTTRTNAVVAGALAASTTEECAKLVPTEERRRGKGAFFSGCTSRSMTSSRGGCWSSLVEEESGCQTCIVQVRILWLYRLQQYVTSCVLCVCLDVARVGAVLLSTGFTRRQTIPTLNAVTSSLGATTI